MTSASRSSWKLSRHTPRTSENSASLNHPMRQATSSAQPGLVPLSCLYDGDELAGLKQALESASAEPCVLGHSFRKTSRRRRQALGHAESKGPLTGSQRGAG